MATRTNKKDSQEYDQVYTFSLLHMGLSAGMMIKDNLINLINTMLPTDMGETIGYLSKCS